MRKILLILTLVTLVTFALSDPSSDLKTQINQLVESRSWKGIQIQITKKGQSIFYHDKGVKNQKNESIDSNTVFRIASTSKSFTSVAIMQLVEQGRLNLNDTLTKHLGFQVKNPHYPDIPITIEMLLSHQSSIDQQQTQYVQFLTDIDKSPDGSSVPSPRQILIKGGKYYNPLIFAPEKKPGEYFTYSNLGYMIAGTIVQKVVQQRFDVYMKQNILVYFSEGQVQNCTHNPVTLKNPFNLGVLYWGNHGKWIPSFDNYNGNIPLKNLSLYKIGTNAGVFSPQAGLRASVKHLNNYMLMFGNEGMLKNGKRLLTEQSVNQILKPRYQYHGLQGGPKMQMHQYGFGMFTTTFDKTDTILDHQTIRGHNGEDMGLISGYSFWRDYTFSYIINGALNGYEQSKNTIYEVDRQVIHQAIGKFIDQFQKLNKFQQKTE